jgi:hypothetical protein
MFHIYLCRLRPGTVGGRINIKKIRFFYFLKFSQNFDNKIKKKLSVKLISAKKKSAFKQISLPTDLPEVGGRQEGVGVAPLTARPSLTHDGPLGEFVVGRFGDDARGKRGQKTVAEAHLTAASHFWWCVTTQATTTSLK